MEKLPQEMVDLIAHHLGNIWWIKDSRKIPLSNYATISKKWKKAIESIVFKYIRVRDLDKAQQILGASGGRWSYVRHITYHIPLAGPGPDFAARMKSLLEFINHHWHVPGSLKLMLSCDGICSAGVWECREKGHYHADDLISGTFPSLDRDQTEPVLPKTPAVSYLEYNCYYTESFELHPDWMSTIKTAMPSVSEMKWTFVQGDLEPIPVFADNFKPQDNDLTSNITLALESLDTSNLQVLRLRMESYDDWDLELSGPSEWYSQWGPPGPAMPQYVVSMNRALRKVSMQLRELSLDGWFNLTPEFFWSREEQEEEEEEHWHAEGAAAGPIKPLWPRLERIKIGVWGPNLLDDNFDYDDDYLAEFNKLIVAISKGMLRMPELRSFVIESDDLLDRQPKGCQLQFPFCYEGCMAVWGLGEPGYLPLGVFAYSTKWKAPAEVLENWQRLCKQVNRKEAISPGRFIKSDFERPEHPRFEPLLKAMGR